MKHVYAMLAEAAEIWEPLPETFAFGYVADGARIGYVGLTESGDPDEGIYVDLIEIDQEHSGRGHGSAALDALCALADRHGVALFLNAEPAGRLGAEDLLAWYGRRGFEVCAPFPEMAGVSMTRSAREPAQEPGI